jgi:hypothetical protein
VAPEDIRWILSLVAPRQIAKQARRYRELELDARTIARSDAAIAKAVSPGALTRGELARALERARISPAGQRLAFLLQHAELRAIVCSGARRGKQSTYAALDGRAPPLGAAFDRDRALAELAKRYFETRGPATVDDFAWWSGFALSEARAGVEANRSLASEVAFGKTFWRSEPGPSAAAPCTHLLPPFDEYLIAYRHRGDLIDPAHVQRVNAGGGMLGPSVVTDGRVVGTWRRTFARGKVVIEIDPFDAPKSTRAIEKAAQRYAAFLGLEMDLSFARRRRASPKSASKQA